MKKIVKIRCVQCMTVSFWPQKIPQNLNLIFPDFKGISRSTWTDGHVLKLRNTMYVNMHEKYLWSELS